MGKNNKSERKHDIYPEIVAVYINKGIGYLVKAKYKKKTFYYSLGKDGDPYAEKLFELASLAKMTKQKVWIRYWGKEASNKHIPDIVTFELR